LVNSAPENAYRRPAQLSEAEIVAAAIPCNLTRIAGIYFLISDGSVVYVGQSVDVYRRIASHVTTKQFDAIHVLPCPEVELVKVESDYIRKLNPPLNRAGRIKAAA
jgi:excinuclease UvrABC nuclease subunit